MRPRLSPPWTRSGKVDLFTDPRGKIYNYDYDTLNRLITSTYAADSGGVVRTETKTYDIAGNLATFKNRAGAVQTFTYDTRNRETKYVWSTGSPQTRTLAYDEASRITACNTSSTFINFAYYADNTLKSQEEWTSYYADNNHRTLTYTCDADGNRASAVLTGTSVLGYTYTARGQLAAVKNGIGRVSYVDYIYDKNGNPTTRTLQSSPASTFLFDAMNRVTNITHNFTSTTRTLKYAYDTVGRRTYVQRDAALADGFGYDLNDQATSFRRNGTLSGSTVSGGTLSTLNFDPNGNRTSVVTGGTTTTYLAANNLNQYPTIGGAGATYDANGNLYTYNGWTYTYDSMKRLTLASGPGTTANFYYDGLNRQVARTITGSTTKFSVWDGWNLYAEYSPANVISERLVYGAGGDLVKSLTNSRNYYSDGLGSTTHVATAVGGLLESYTYDLNGTPTFYNAAGTVLPGGTAYGINRLYTGQQWHSQLGLYDNRNRFLLPSLGRFLQPDPIGFAGDSANMYRYCGNNPVNWSDPYGLTDGVESNPNGDDGVTETPGGGFRGRLSVRLKNKETSANAGGSTTSEGFTPGAPSVSPAGVLLGYGGGLGGGGGGGGGRRLKAAYSRSNLRRLDQALPRVFGPIAILIPPQTLENAPPVDMSFSRSQLGIMGQVFGGGDAGGADGGFFEGTIYISRETLASRNSNYFAEIYFHELGNYLSYELTGDPSRFGRIPNILNNDPDTGAQLYLQMFGNVIPLP